MPAGQRTEVRRGTLKRAPLLLFGLMMLSALDAQQYTLGVGVYPGDPNENFAPVMRVDQKAYRNLALHRPAYQSSSSSLRSSAVMRSPA